MNGGIELEFKDSIEEARGQRGTERSEKRKKELCWYEGNNVMTESVILECRIRATRSVTPRYRALHCGLPGWS